MTDLHAPRSDPGTPGFPPDAAREYRRALTMLAAAERAERLHATLAVERAVLQACDEVLRARAEMCLRLLDNGWEAPPRLLMSLMRDTEVAQTPCDPLG